MDLDRFKLDPDVAAHLAEVNTNPGPSVWEIPAEDVRRNLTEFFKTLRSPGSAIGKREDKPIPGPYCSIPIRIYWPPTAHAGQPLPVFINFHGSGYVIFGVDDYDHICKRLCRAAGCIAIGVDYCKAPEFKFPKPVEESFEATKWIAEHISEFGGDPSRIAIGGDSAGGCLATVVAHRAKDQGGPKLIYQLLVYPVTDADEARSSYQRFGSGFMLTANTMKWYFECYLNSDQERQHPWAAPLRAEDLSGLPPALIIARVMIRCSRRAMSTPSVLTARECPQNM